jgi:hypothetical protein
MTLREDYINRKPTLLRRTTDHFFIRRLSTLNALRQRLLALDLITLPRGGRLPLDKILSLKEKA